MSAGDYSDFEHAFLEWELAHFDAFNRKLLSPGGVNQWRQFRAMNPDRALRMASKSVSPSMFARISFADVPYDEKRVALKALAAGQASSITHWPVVLAVLVDILERPRKRDFLYSQLLDDLGEAYGSLSSNQQEIVRTRVTMDMAWEPDECAVCRRYPPDAYQRHPFPLVSFGRELASETVRTALKRTVGQVSFFCASPELDELAGVVRAIGCPCPREYFLTLDFQTDPLSWGEFKAFDPCAAKEAVPDIEASLLPESELPFDKPKPPEQGPVLDYLSCYHWYPEVGPRIVLRVERIADCTVRVGARFEDLFTVAWIHAFAHLAHLGIPDADGLFNRSQNAEFAETVAQWATWQAIRSCPDLSGAFERLLRHQSPIYHGWTSLKNSAKEELRAVLWCLRTGRPGFNSCELRASVGLGATDAESNP